MVLESAPNAQDESRGGGLSGGSGCNGEDKMGEGGRMSLRWM